MDNFVNDESNISGYKLKKQIGEGGAGIVYLLKDKNNNKIIKKVYRTITRGGIKKSESRLHRNFLQEVKILQILSGNEHFPKLVYYDSDKHEIYMTLCGERLTTENVPKDWKRQLLSILKILKKNDISHNSSSMNNTCVKDGVMYFIDFAHSGEYVPGNRNLTKRIVREARIITDVYDSKKTRMNHTKNK